MRNLLFPLLKNSKSVVMIGVTAYELPTRDGDLDQVGSKNGRRTLKIFWENWYAREISRFVCNKVRLFEVGRLWELYD